MVGSKLYYALVCVHGFCAWGEFFSVLVPRLVLESQRDVCVCVLVCVCVCVCVRVFPPERNDGRASSLCVLGRRPGFIVIGSVPESCVGIGSMRHQS